MKKNTALFVLIALLMLPQLLLAQVDRGKIYVGALSNLGLSQINTISKSDNWESDPVKEFSLNFNPRAGYCLFLKGLVLGGEIPLSYIRTEEANGDVDKVTEYTFGPFVRYYYRTLYVKPFAEVCGGFGNRVEKFDYADIAYPDYEYKYGIRYLNLNVGAAYFIGTIVSVDIKLGYGWKTATNKDSDIGEKESSHGFSTEIGISLFFK